MMELGWLGSRHGEDQPSVQPGVRENGFRLFEARNSVDLGGA